MSEFELQSEMLNTLEVVSRWLNQNLIPHSIIGGVAVSLLTEPRATNDIDLTVWCDDISAEQLLQSAAPFMNRNEWAQ